MLDFGIVINAVLLVMGLVWCKHIVARLPSDIDEIKTSTDATERLVIVAFWVTTLCVMFWIVNFIVGLF